MATAGGEGGREWLGRGLCAHQGELTIFYNYNNIIECKFENEERNTVIALLGNGKFRWQKTMRSHEVIWKPSIIDVCWKTNAVERAILQRFYNLDTNLSTAWKQIFVLYLQNQSALTESDSFELFRCWFEPLLHFITFLHMFSIRKLFSFGCQHLGLDLRWHTYVLITTTESSLRSNLV